MNDVTSVQLFLKAPRLGTVKTRLAASIGAEKALGVYRQLVKRQLKQIGQPLEIHYAPAGAEQEFHEWLGGEHQLVLQSEGDLGRRLERAVSGAFEAGQQRVICIGGDCPALNIEHIRQTHDLLDSGKDLVFGPTEDGGYYLLGLSRPFSGLFQDIPWSTDTTLSESLRKAETLALRVGLLETLYDIDEVDDLHRAIQDGYLPA